MRNIICFLLISLASSTSAQTINWVGIEQAEKEMEKYPRKQLFIDFYTDWCGWCKKMDQSTFMEPEVVKHINENYIAIKFDAETQDDVVFRGKLYKYVKPTSGRGVNSFAYFSLKGRLSYPSYAVLNQNGETQKILIGFMPKETLIEGLME